MFEKYNFAGVFIQVQAVLSLYAQGTLSLSLSPLPPLSVYRHMYELAHLQTQNVLVLFLTCIMFVSFPGLLTGLVIDSGDGVTHVV